MTTNSPPRPVVLCILDGWGHREETDANAIRQAETPTFDRLYQEAPWALLDASAHEVGLPEGQMGNSEVGHMNLGAGRIVLQDLPKIDKEVETGALRRNSVLLEFVDNLKTSGGTAHLMGLMSPGGVHSHQRHMAEIANTLRDAGVPVAVHAFLDGRDTPPRSAVDFLKTFMDDAPNASVATVTGRFFAMDRDNRWDRVGKAFDALVCGKGEKAPDPIAAVEQSYAKDANDEFVEPTVIGAYTGMRDGDGLLMANFRADRAREILAALLDPDFDGFAAEGRPNFAAAVGMVEYSKNLNPFLKTLYPPEDLRHTLGDVVSRAGQKQLRIAETEKYAHVTFFLNGGREDPFEGEERILIPSPKVTTYDLQPEMSAPEVTDALVAAIESGTFDLIVCNYANGDMVGHTGDLNAAIKAAETLDACVSRLSKAVAAAKGVMLITADHGNAEQMSDEKTGQAHTAHTMNKVPIILVNGPKEGVQLSDGRLADVAPTLLDLMGLPKPDAMTGSSLIASPAREAAAE